MKKIVLKLITTVFIFITALIVAPEKVYAAPCDGATLCSEIYPYFRPTINPEIFVEHDEILNITVDGLSSGKEYEMYVDCSGLYTLGNDYNDNAIIASGENDQFTWSNKPTNRNCYNALFAGGRATRYVCLKEEGALVCSVGYYELLSRKQAEDIVERCDRSLTPPYPAVEHLENTTLTISGLLPNEHYHLTITGPGIGGFCSVWKETDSNGDFVFHDLTKGEDNGEKTWETCIQGPGTFTFILEPGLIPGFLNPNLCKFTQTVYSENKDPYTKPEGLIETFHLLRPEECCLLKDSLCQDLSKPECQKRCLEKGILTALGCFPTEPKAIVSWILKYAIILGGGIAFLLMLYGAFLIIVSAGDPEKLKEGQQILSSALTGLLFVIFAVFLLRLIGFTILRIPGFK